LLAERALVAGWAGGGLAGCSQCGLGNDRRWHCGPGNGPWLTAVEARCRVLTTGVRRRASSGGWAEEALARPWWFENALAWPTCVRAAQTNLQNDLAEIEVPNASRFNGLVLLGSGASP
jgi:hypothetical protein